MTRDELTRWLTETDPARLTELWRRADAARQSAVGHAVHLRALLEISNYCIRLCLYCGLRAPNTCLLRYRMTAGEIAACAAQAAAHGCGTLVLQAGEDEGLTTIWVADLVRRLKAETGLAITLSLGERGPTELAAWRRAGADRYLLRFETSNNQLLTPLHPARPGQQLDRRALLRTLRDLGYEVGSGTMIGLPGQSFADLASDLLLFRELDLDMIGVGPYIPHPDTPLGAAASHKRSAATQVPADELTTYKVIALARLLCPLANIPATTALATLNPQTGYELGLQRGANVIMPNFTPAPYRRAYDVYPGKPAARDDLEHHWDTLTARLAALGRPLGSGPGASPNWLQRHADTAAERPRRWA